MQPKISVTAIGAEGTVEVDRLGWRSAPGMCIRGKLSAAAAAAAGGLRHVEQTVDVAGMEDEVDSFVRAARGGGGTAREGGDRAALGDPRQGFVDLAMIEALLRAGRTGHDERIAKL